MLNKIIIYPDSNKKDSFGDFLKQQNISILFKDNLNLNEEKVIELISKKYIIMHGRNHPINDFIEKIIETKISLEKTLGRSSSLGIHLSEEYKHRTPGYLIYLTEKNKQWALKLLEFWLE